MVGFLSNHGKSACIINMYRNTSGEADGNSQIKLFPGLFAVSGLQGNYGAKPGLIIFIHQWNWGIQFTFSSWTM